MATGVQELKLAVGMQEWSARIAECRSSGMSVRAWCNEQGISAQTYYRWEKRFAEKAPPAVQPPGSHSGRFADADQSGNHTQR